MSEKIYPKGLRTFPPREGAPDFVKGTLIITLNELIQFCKDNSSLLTEYRDQKQLRCNILEGDKGLYFQVDTYRPDASQRPEPLDSSESLPF